MRKLTCHAWSWCIVLAGTSAVLLGQELVPPAPMPPGAAEAFAAPPSRELIPSPAEMSPVPPARPAAAAVSPAPCPAEYCPHCGCCHREDICCGVRPLGASVYAQVCTQVHNGMAAQMVLYQYDFHDPAVGDPSTLNRSGLRRLDEIVQFLRHGHACPVTIEQTEGSPALDAARQMHVLTLLGESSLSPQIVIGDTPPELRGNEALLIYRSLLQQTATGGATFVRQTSSGSGSSGSSSGASSGPSELGTSQ